MWARVDEASNLFTHESRVWVCRHPGFSALLQTSARAHSCEFCCCPTAFPYSGSIVDSYTDTSSNSKGLIICRTGLLKPSSVLKNPLQTPILLSSPDSSFTLDCFPCHLKARFELIRNVFLAPGSVSDPPFGLP